MAKSSNRGGGEGTNDRGGVRSTLQPPFKGGSSTGSQGKNMPGPFDQGRSGGDNGLPTHIYDDSMKRSTSGMESSRDSLGVIWTDPNGPRRG